MPTTSDVAAADPIWRLCAEDRPAWWRPLAPNPWPGSRRAYPCPWGCNGTGHLPHFRHIANGACFGCKGRGWLYGRNPISDQTSQQARRWRREGRRIVRFTVEGRADQAARVARLRARQAAPQ